MVKEGYSLNHDFEMHYEDYEDGNAQIQNQKQKTGFSEIMKGDVPLPDNIKPYYTDYEVIKCRKVLPVRYRLKARNTLPETNTAYAQISSSAP